MTDLLKEDTITTISVNLSESEIRQKGCELVTELNNLEALKEEKKSTARLMKEKEEFLLGRIKTLKEIVNTGVESMEQPCFKVYDFEEKVVYWETFKGLKYHERSMRDDELGKSIRMAESDVHEQAAMDVM